VMTMAKVVNEVVREVSDVWVRLAASGANRCVYILGDGMGNIITVEVHYDCVGDTLTVRLGLGKASIAIRDLFSSSVPVLVFLSILGFITPVPLHADAETIYDYVKKLMDSLVLIKEVCWG